MNATTTPDAASPKDAPPRFPFDAVYKALFGRPRTVADMMRGYAAAPGGPFHPDVLDALDLGTLRRLPDEWITEEFRARRADRIWRIDFKPEARERGYPRRLFVDLEFQSRNDHDMALRFLEYGAELYRELRAGEAAADDARCPLLCVVLYNGAGRWSASASTAGLLGAPDVFGRPTVPDGVKAFRPWGYWPLDFADHAGAPPVPGNALSLIMGFESVRKPNDPAAQDLAALMWETARLDEPVLRGIMTHWLALLAEHYNLNLPGLEELTAMNDVTVLTSRLEDWFRGLAALAAEGEARGEARGDARMREMLRHQAMRKFSAAAAARLADHLADVRDPARLSEAGDWIVDCDTDEQLDARIGKGSR